MHADLLSTIPHNLFTVTEPLVEKVLRTVAVYAGILLLLRLAGKRDLAQLNSFDLVVLLLLSNVVQNAVIGNDNSLLGGLLGAATLIVVNAIVVRSVARSDLATRIVEGSPTTLVTDGHTDDATLARIGLRPASVVIALRRQGAQSIADINEAVLEPNGSIVFSLHPDAEAATLADIKRIEAKLDRLLATD